MRARAVRTGRTLAPAHPPMAAADTREDGQAGMRAIVQEVYGSADRLGLSLKTVNNNISSIFTRLNVGSRTEAAILARDRGLGIA